MFRLGFRTDIDTDGDTIPDPAWCFSVTTSTAGTGESRACTTDYVVEGDWISLAGIHDPISQKIMLYVNGVPEFEGSYAEATYTGAWSATGPFALGRAWNGAATQRWIGELDHVYATQRVWNEQEVGQHAAQ
jgi:hypothetical protein